MEFDIAFAWSILPELFQGLLVTVQVVVLGFLLAVLLGLILALTLAQHSPEHRRAGRCHHPGFTAARVISAAYCHTTIVSWSLPMTLVKVQYKAISINSQAADRRLFKETPTCLFPITKLRW